MLLSKTTVNVKIIYMGHTDNISVPFTVSIRQAFEYIFHSIFIHCVLIEKFASFQRTGRALRKRDIEARYKLHLPF